MEHLFPNQFQASDPVYINIRDGKDVRQVVAKQLSEALWEKYYPHADQHFLTEITKQFDSRFWEM